MITVDIYEDNDPHHLNAGYAVGLLAIATVVFQLLFQFHGDRPTGYTDLQPDDRIVHIHTR